MCYHKYVLSYLENNKINDVFQSAYIPHHSTETAVIKIFSDICISMGRKREVILCLFDLSSAFDTLKHTILLQRLQRCGIWCSSRFSIRYSPLNIYCISLSNVIRKHNISYHMGLLLLLLFCFHHVL